MPYVVSCEARGADEPEYYRLRRYRAEDWNGAAVVILRTALPAETMGRWIRGQVAELDPTVPVEIETVSERIHRLADQPLFETVLVGLFAATGLLMAMIGLYGVLAFLAARRTQEIGLRMALGASRRDIVRVMLASGLRLLLPGMFVGLLMALAATRMLASLLFHVGPNDPMTFTVATALLLALLWQQCSFRRPAARDSTQWKLCAKNSYSRSELALRARDLIQMGVPTNWKASRIWFSRKRR